MANPQKNAPQEPPYTRDNPPPVLGTEEPTPPGTPQGPDEGSGEKYYAGTYLTREETEKGIQEAQGAISRLQSERDQAARRASAVEGMLDRFVSGKRDPQSGYTPPSPQPTYAHDAPTAPPPALPLKDLKFRSPLDDEDGFREDLTSYQTAVVREATNQAAATVMGWLDGQRETREREAALWDYFKTLHPDLAGEEHQVRSTFLRLYQGRHPEDITGMMDRVATETRAEIARIRGQPVQPQNQPPPTPGRTEGIPSGTAPAPSAPPASKPTRMLTDELKDLQKKSGFF